jgi:hypothetical protein
MSAQFLISMALIRIGAFLFSASLIAAIISFLENSRRASLCFGIMTNVSSLPRHPRIEDDQVSKRIDERTTIFSMAPRRLRSRHRAGCARS